MNEGEYTVHVYFTTSNSEDLIFIDTLHFTIENGTNNQMGLLNSEQSDCYNIMTYIEEPGLARITVFPNPAQSVITINTEGIIQGNLEIYDILGNRIYSKSILSETILNIDIRDLKPGLYFYILNSIGEKFTGKFSKTN